MKISNLAYWLVSFIALVVILWYGKNIILPFVLALIIWYLKRELVKLIKKIKIRQKELPNWLQHVVALLFVLFILVTIGEILSLSIKGISNALPVYETNLIQLQHQLSEKFNIDLFQWFQDHSTNNALMSFFKAVLNSVTALVGHGLLVVFYIIFLVVEANFFAYKLKAIYATDEQYNQAISLLSKIDKSLSRYIVLKTIVSLLTGVLSYLVLLLIGVDFAIFWAFLIFVLNYIPTVGSLFATAFPAIIVIMQTGSIGPALMVLAGVGSIQIVVGNAIEPKLMGDSLNISPLIVLISLVLWGSLWGVLGMIIAVPISVILIIILSQFPSTRNIAVVLSKKGIID